MWFQWFHAADASCTGRGLVGLALLFGSCPVPSQVQRELGVGGDFPTDVLDGGRGAGDGEAEQGGWWRTEEGSGEGEGAGSALRESHMLPA